MTEKDLRIEYKLSTGLEPLDLFQDKLPATLDVSELSSLKISDITGENDINVDVSIDLNGDSLVLAIPYIEWLENKALG